MIFHRPRGTRRTSTDVVRSRPINIQTETERPRYSYVERTNERPVTQTRVTTTEVTTSAPVVPVQPIIPEEDYEQGIRREPPRPVESPTRRLTPITQVSLCV